MFVADPASSLTQPPDALDAFSRRYLIDGLALLQLLADGSHMFVNAFNDNRQARLYLKDEALELYLLDPDAQVMDVAGDGGPAFKGGPNGASVYSMERRAGAIDGTLPESWAACPLNQGSGYVSEDYRDIIIATPGEDKAATVPSTIPPLT